MTNQKLSGFIAAGLACVLWGTSPLYWWLFIAIPASHITVIRTLSCVFAMVGLMTVMRQWHVLSRLRLKQWLSLFAASIFIGLNWFIYALAIEQGKVLECSLGYYLSPIITVFLAHIVLKEPLSFTAKCAVAASALGVVIMAVGVGSLPWISLALAVNFSIYGLIKKALQLDVLATFTVECLMIAPFALAAGYFVDWSQAEALSDELMALLVLSSGMITALPLLFYNRATRLIPLSYVSMVRFAAPTLKFIIGVFILGEAFEFYKLIGFGFIWLGVILFLWPKLRAMKQQNTMSSSF